MSQLTGLPLEKIEVELGNSSFPAGPVSGGSWATAIAMSVIAGAPCEAIKRLRQYAVADSAPFAGAKPDSLLAENGTLAAGDRHVSFADILASQRLTRAEGFLHSDGADMSKFSFRSFACILWKSAGIPAFHACAWRGLSAQSTSARWSVHLPRVTRWKAAS